MLTIDNDIVLKQNTEKNKQTIRDWFAKNNLRGIFETSKSFGFISEHEKPNEYNDEFFDIDSDYTMFPIVNQLAHDCSKIDFTYIMRYNEEYEVITLFKNGELNQIKLLIETTKGDLPVILNDTWVPFPNSFCIRKDD